MKHVFYENSYSVAQDLCLLLLDFELSSLTEFLYITDDSYDHIHGFDDWMENISCERRLDDVSCET